MLAVSRFQRAEHTVSDDCGTADSDFNGRIACVQIDLGEDAHDADHLITMEERYRVAVALQ